LWAQYYWKWWFVLVVFIYREKWERGERERERGGEKEREMNKDG
jgi:hypothetical protein